MPSSFSAHGSTAEQDTDTLRPPPLDAHASPSHVLYESGIPPAGTLSRTLAARGEAHAQAALAASTRTEANLGALLRTLQHAAALVGNSRDAENEVLLELESLRALLAQSDEEQLSLRQRAALLEQTLERTEREAARERAFLIDEQDTFIAALWDDHSLEQSELRRRLSLTEDNLAASREENQSLATQLQSANALLEEMTRRTRKAEGELTRAAGDAEAARDTLMRLQMEREEALLAASQAQRERDHLRAELARQRSQASLRASSVPAASSSSVAQEAPPSSPGTPIPLVTRSEPRMPQTRPLSLRLSEEPPEELRAALTEGDAPPRAQSGIAPKPAATRPSLGYSLTGDQVPQEERTDGSRSESR